MTEDSGRHSEEHVTPLRPETKLSELNRTERKAISEHSRPNAALIHETIRADAEAELDRQWWALFLSGLAAGLSIGLSLVVQALLQHGLPDAPWRHLVASLGYTVGFVVVILGRQQLFTENTLAPVLPLLHRPGGAMLLSVARLWVVVLLANLLGAYAFGWFISLQGVFEPGVQQTMAEISRHALEPGFAELFVKGIVAGWLIALTLWLLPGSSGSGILTIMLLTWVIALGKFAHVIAGSVEVFYLIHTGEAGWSDFFIRFLAPCSPAMWWAAWHWWRCWPTDKRRRSWSERPLPLRGEGEGKEKGENPHRTRVVTMLVSFGLVAMPKRARTLLPCFTRP